MNLELPAAVLCFLAPHIVPSVPGLRPWFITKMGRAGYFSAYFVISLITFFWLIVAVLRAPYTGLWALQPWHVHVVLVLVALACVLLVAALITPNPLSLSLRRTGPDVPMDAVFRITRHPLLWAFGLWSLSHVLANGDVASVVLFGILAAFALGYMPLLDRRMQRAMGMTEWSRLSAGTSMMLFKSFFDGNARPCVDRRLMLAVTGGLLLFLLLLMLHGAVIGVNPVGAIL